LNAECPTPLEDAAMSMEKPTVAQLCLTLNTGGLEKVVVNLANELSRGKRAHPHIFTVGQTTANLLPECVASEVDWTELQGPPSFSLKTAYNLVSQLRRHNVRLIHAHGTQPLVYALMASLVTGLPVIYTKHNSYEDLGFFLRRPFFNRLACSRVKRFVGVSDAATEILRRVFPQAAGNCSTQINGTELPSRSLRVRVQTVRQGGLVRGPFVFSTVCRLSPEKDIATMLRAFAKVHAAVPKTELWIVGDGAERGMLVSLAGQLGLADAVRFWGFRGKIQQILSCSEVFVNSSLTEGVSISILEAMSIGLPIVATDVGGTSSIVRQDENGLLVEPRNVDALANAMTRLAVNLDLCHALGERSATLVRERWSLQRMAGNYLGLYHDILRAHSGETFEAA
jgi:glycosyltransferase involved in cell wall biosynthesis